MSVFFLNEEIHKVIINFLFVVNNFTIHVSFDWKFYKLRADFYDQAVYYRIWLEHLLQWFLGVYFLFANNSFVRNSIVLMLDGSIDERLIF